MIKNVKIFGILALISLFSFIVFALEQDIGLRVHDKSVNEAIGVKSKSKTTSPLKIEKNGKKYGIELVPPTHPLATDVMIQTPNDGIRAFKKRERLCGEFKCKLNSNKWTTTWLSTITCADYDGNPHVISYPDRNNALTLADRVWDAVYEINGNSTTGDIKIPSTKIFESILRRTKCTRAPSPWLWDESSGVDAKDTLNATCKLLGYDKHISSTCHDNIRHWRYPRGRCNWHTTRDNYTCWFVPSTCK